VTTDLVANGFYSASSEVAEGKKIKRRPQLGRE